MYFQNDRAVVVFQGEFSDAAPDQQPPGGHGPQINHRPDV